MLQPKKSEWRKRRKGRLSGAETRGTTPAFGSLALKALGFARLTARQIEAARKAIVRCTARQGQLWIRVFPDCPVTRKPNEVRMGSGKGNVEFYCAPVRPGRVIFELGGVDEAVARKAFAQAAEKLPFQCKIVVPV